ncbi:phosphate ABC transporter substrate-binding protein [Clostridium isatidis]|uniref:phosphate ABC transporter substrate-binding protein n=1 Tax=Clostridium isatidis TaxID=182773 RepID=UPI003AAB379E
MKKINSRIIYMLLILGSISIYFTSCASASNNESNSSGNAIIGISGSTSVGPLMEKLAEAYEEENQGVSIEINQVGSSAGIKDAINGISEIGMSSRDLKEEEKQEVKGTVIAYDGIAVITNKENPIKNLSMDEIRGIFTGEITNWKEIEGGKDAPIVVASREDGSGTRDAFQELVDYTTEDLIRNSLISNGNGGLKQIVIGNKNAVAFVSFEYLDDSVNIVRVDGIEPTAEAVRNGNYKISRPFLVVTKESRLTENGQELIDFILSEEGQKIVIDNKLIPVK